MLSTFNRTTLFNFLFQPISDPVYNLQLDFSVNFSTSNLHLSVTNFFLLFPLTHTLFQIHTFFNSSIIVFSLMLNVGEQAQKPTSILMLLLQDLKKIFLLKLNTTQSFFLISWSAYLFYFISHTLVTFMRIKTTLQVVKNQFQRIMHLQ